MKRIFVMVMVLMIAMTSASVGAFADGDVFAKGAKGDEVKKMQSRLIELGFLSTTADGDFGKKTQDAVTLFEQYLKNAGYPSDENGAMNKNELACLYDDERMERRMAVRLGDNNALVGKMQTRLQKLGYFLEVVDGVFGSMTQSALETFQQMLRDAGESQITVNGVADKATRALLYSDLSGYPIDTPATFDDSNPIALNEHDLYARAFILIDAGTGETLLQLNANERMYPASTTKIMTLLLAIEYGHLNDVITVPESADSVPGDSSRVPVHAKEQMPFKDLLYGLMIKSGNDAANAIATLTSGSVDKFVAKMNARAEKIGMKNTHFANPHGYHSSEHYTTAYDMARLTATALNNETFRKIVQTKKYTLSKTALREALTIKNSYAILDSSSKYYYEYAFGIKTGHTSKAGQCYVGAAIKDGRKLIAVVFDSRVDRNYKYLDAKRLFRYGFAQLETEQAA